MVIQCLKLNVHAVSVGWLIQFMAIHSLRFHLTVINNLSDLIAAFKAWWHAPIKIELKKKEPEAMTPEEFKKLPPSILEVISNGSMKVMADRYYENLRDRVRHGEHLTVEERYRLRMKDHIDGINGSYFDE